MNKNISEIYGMIQELSWYFGNQGFSDECCGDLSLVEYMAVKKVSEEDDISMQDIGIALNITKSGVSKIIDRLENKGYVLRKQSSIDGRVCCVAITGKGSGVIARIVEVYTDYVGEMLQNLEADAVENVKTGFELLIASVRKQGFIKPNERLGN